MNQRTSSQGIARQRRAESEIQLSLVRPGSDWPLSVPAAAQQPNPSDGTKPEAAARLVELWDYSWPGLEIHQRLLQRAPKIGALISLGNRCHPPSNSRSTRAVSQRFTFMPLRYSAVGCSSVRCEMPDTDPVNRSADLQVSLARQPADGVSVICLHIRRR
jgi:hypothetical protein